MSIVDLGNQRRTALRMGSRTLSELVDADERARALLGEESPLANHAGYLDTLRAAHAADAMRGLRLERRRQLAAIAASDLAGDASLEDVMLALSDLADASLSVALAHVEAPDDLAVIGMGKLGAQELNYSSDIDVMFIAEADALANSKVVERLLQELGGSTPEGQAYRIDANLRPEGRSGPLLRSLEGYVEYYERWAKPWEFQALIKARPAAGSDTVGAAFIDAVQPLVFSEQVDQARVSEIRAMKERLESHAARSARRAKASEVDDVKLGPGGILVIEFAVQLLQLVHGGIDPSVRQAATLPALDSLVAGGYVADEDGAALQVAYRWLRAVEHRLQLWQERQVHRLPGGHEGRSRLARTLGFKDTPATSAVSRFQEAHGGVLSDTRARFDKLFYRPMIEALAGAGPARLSPGALNERLRVLGFRDVARASHTLEQLVAGGSRRAKLLRVLTPSFLRSVAAAPLPDEGLFSFLRLGDALESRIELLGALRDNPPAIALLANVLGSGRLLGDILIHVPEVVTSVAETGGPRPPKPRDQLAGEAVASLAWREPEKRLDGLRRFKRREMLRVAVADIAGAIDVDAVGAALADLAEACLHAALNGRSDGFAVIGMGKLGGRELSYASDLDVMFLHADGNEGEALAGDLLRAIGEVTPEGQAFRIDPSIRPEGRSGPLVRSLRSFEEYYRRWAQPWERQALIKARPVAGDVALGQAFMKLATDVLYETPLNDAELREIRHLKARMEKERIPRGVDPKRDMKMGPGGASDVEFAVQIAQLRLGLDAANLRTTNTIEALTALADAGAIAADECHRLARAYRFVALARNRLFFMRGRPTDALPVKPEELEALGIALGYTKQPRQELEEDYLRLTRRARRITEPLIYG